MNSISQPSLHNRRIVDIKALEITEWKTPATDYSVRQVGNYRIGKHTYQPGFYAYHGIDGYAIFSIKRLLRMTSLMELRANNLGMLHWKEWMVDTPTDYRAMQKYAEMAYGRVLTCGLGLGLITHELCKNDKVENITVVEISPSVIELVKGYLPPDPRIKVELSDFWEFVAQDSSHWDFIIADIWVYWGLEQQIEMYKTEIMPASEKLRAKYPDAQVVFHGFAGMPTREQLDNVARMGDDTNPMVIDPLIYGLGNGNGAKP